MIESKLSLKAAYIIMFNILDKWHKLVKVTSTKCQTPLSFLSEHGCNNGKKGACLLLLIRSTFCFPCMYLTCTWMNNWEEKGKLNVDMRLLKETEEPHLNNMQCIWMVQVLYMKPYYTYVSKMFSKHIPKDIWRVQSISITVSSNWLSVTLGQVVILSLFLIIFFSSIKVRYLCH